MHHSGKQTEATSNINDQQHDQPHEHDLLCQTSNINDQQHDQPHKHDLL
jgi:hypothetical protein